MKKLIASVGAVVMFAKKVLFLLAVLLGLVACATVRSELSANAMSDRAIRLDAGERLA